MVVVLCSCPPDRAEDLARALVDARLVACAQIVPGVTSVYRWKGEVCVEPEANLVLKLARDGVAALSERLRALHPYDLPEIVVLDVDVAASDPRYVRWVRDETRPPEGP